jgi:hypothetical protein
MSGPPLSGSEGDVLAAVNELSHTVEVAGVGAGSGNDVIRLERRSGNAGPAASTLGLGTPVESHAA